eukprot:3929549-Prymnesium_polylepis.1
MPPPTLLDQLGDVSQSSDSARTMAASRSSGSCPSSFSCVASHTSRRCSRQLRGGDLGGALPPVVAPAIGSQTHDHLAATSAQHSGWRMMKTNEER